ncbi:hypothetical protein RvY_17420 [Ramazzottius varieornatus]|uniref:Uncharacterized protein n=1 Tax=Ramazzottius varieornatus TaxID=947166 RepID=A0A1D1W499_RAMVA|nr:hypothetical protein RvY_17420 [Ramazzottius varieornatus]
MSMLDLNNVGNNFFALRQIERDKLKEEADELRRVLNAELESDTFRELQVLQSRKSKPLTEEERLSLDFRTEDAETSPQPDWKQEEKPPSTAFDVGFL